MPGKNLYYPSPRRMAQDIVERVQNAASDLAHSNYGYALEGDAAADYLYEDSSFVVKQVSTGLDLIPRRAKHQIGEVVLELMELLPQVPESEWEKLLSVYDPKGTTMAKTKKAEGWPTKPDGWDKGSMRKYFSTLTGPVKHKVTKCIKELKGASWLDDPSDPAPFCASLADELEGTDWRKGPRKKRKSSEATEAALPTTQLQTQKRYLQEKGKGKPKPQPPKSKDKKPGKLKQWLLKHMNFPQEEIEKMGRTKEEQQKVLDLSDPTILTALIKRDATMREEERPMSRRTRRSRFEDDMRRRRRQRSAAESKLVKEMNPNYDEPAEDAAPDWVEDDYTERPYSDFPKAPKNEREARRSRRDYRMARIKRRIQMVIAEEMERVEAEERRAAARERWERRKAMEEAPPRRRRHRVARRGVEADYDDDCDCRGARRPVARRGRTRRPFRRE